MHVNQLITLKKPQLSNNAKIGIRCSIEVSVTPQTTNDAIGRQLVSFFFSTSYGNLV
ncbi:hypothetical protein HNQ00_001838 [Flavobacterium sp. 14A]|nr:hypothetical protein [Flavobacterium sp. 14A]